MDDIELILEKIRHLMGSSSLISSISDEELKTIIADELAKDYITNYLKKEVGLEATQYQLKKHNRIISIKEEEAKQELIYMIAATVAACHWVPAFFIQNDEITNGGVINTAEDELKELQKHYNHLKSPIKSTGKILTDEGYCGTGIAITANHFLTAKHNITSKIEKLQIDLKSEYLGNDTDRYTVNSVRTDVSLDIAVLEIEGNFKNHINLDKYNKIAANNRRVAMIGYPSPGKYDFDEDCFGKKNTWETKRIHAGEVIEGKCGDNSLLHNCIARGKNSGSPVLEVNTGNIIGLHIGICKQPKKFKALIVPVIFKNIQNLL